MFSSQKAENTPGISRLKGHDYEKYCCIILALALVLAGCSTAKPADSVSSTSETTETNLESISSNESTNPSAGEETSNANCYTIEEVANGAADGTVDEHGIEMFPEEATQKAQDAINGGYVLNGLGATFEDTGITYTLQDVWYETTTDNMQQNYYELNSYVEKPIYIFMTLQAENKDTVEHIFYINDGIIMVFPKSNKVQSAEFTYQDHVTDPIPHNHDYAVCRLAAGEKETYTIAFETESTFADYNPIYLNWQCFPKGMFEDTVEGDMHEVWIKLPELESR